MNDLIARRGAEEVVNEICGILIQRILDTPAVEAVPVTHGKWEWLTSTYDREPCECLYQCSECRHITITHGGGSPWEKFCPNCGAKMRREHGNEHNV